MECLEDSITLDGRWESIHQTSILGAVAVVQVQLQRTRLTITFTNASVTSRFVCIAPKSLIRIQGDQVTPLAKLGDWIEIKVILESIKAVANAIVPLPLRVTDCEQYLLPAAVENQREDSQWIAKMEYRLNNCVLNMRSTVNQAIF
jgi:hypothetical protein